MSIWERLSEATRNLSVGGQISSLFGFGSTSQARKAYSEPDNEVPFTVGVIVLSAKMAKADGTVAADEVKAFQEAFKISAAEMKQAAPLFNSAKRDAANFETYAEQLVTVFDGNRRLLEDVLDGLFHIAKADEESIGRRSNSSVRLPSASASPSASSTRSRPAIWVPPSAIHTTCSA